MKDTRIFFETCKDGPLSIEKGLGLPQVLSLNNRAPTTMLLAGNIIIQSRLGTQLLD